MTPEEIVEEKKIIKKIWDRNNKDHKTKMAKLRRHASRLCKFRLNMKVKTYYYIKRISIGKYPRQLEILGSDALTIKQHFEKLFREGMSWENFGVWQIDHKIPLYSGKTEDEISRLCHYMNLQPLWEAENLKKGKNN